MKYENIEVLWKRCKVHLSFLWIHHREKVIKSGKGTRTYTQMANLAKAMKISLVLLIN